MRMTGWIAVCAAALVFRVCVCSILAYCEDLGVELAGLGLVWQTVRRGEVR